MIENNEIITQCQYCGQFKIDDEWDGIKKEIIRTGNYSHGPCPTCFEQALAEIEAL